MIYEDMTFTVIFNPANPTSFHIVAHPDDPSREFDDHSGRPMTTASLASQASRAVSCEPKEDDPTEDDIRRATAEYRARHLTAKRASKGNGEGHRRGPAGSDGRGPRVVRVSRELAGLAGAWEVMEMAGLTGRGGVGEGGW